MIDFYLKPLSASTNGQRISIGQNQTDVVIHQGVAGETHRIFLQIQNSGSTTTPLTIKSGTVTFYNHSAQASNSAIQLRLDITGAENVTITTGASASSTILVVGEVEVRRQKIAGF